MRISEKTYKAMPAELQALFQKLPNPGSDEVVGLFPVVKAVGRYKEPLQDCKTAHPDGSYNATSYDTKSTAGVRRRSHMYSGQDGSAARFFYVAKASKADRDEGCEGLEERGRNEVYKAGLNTATKCDPSLHTAEGVAARPLRRNHHPTVKPTALMRYLCRLVTPPGGIVLDPFAGSGSTGKGAVLEGFRFIGIEREAEYVEIAKARIAAAADAAPSLFRKPK